MHENICMWAIIIPYIIPFVFLMTIMMITFMQMQNTCDRKKIGTKINKKCLHNKYGCCIFLLHLNFLILLFLCFFQLFYHIWRYISGQGAYNSDVEIFNVRFFTSFFLFYFILSFKYYSNVSEKMIYFFLVFCSFMYFKPHGIQNIRFTDCTSEVHPLFFSNFEIK